MFFGDVCQKTLIARLKTAQQSVLGLAIYFLYKHLALVPHGLEESIIIQPKTQTRDLYN